MAILLPAETPVTSGSELPLNVHWGPVLAVAATVAPAEEPGPTKAVARLQSSRTDMVARALLKRTGNIAAPSISGAILMVTFPAPSHDQGIRARPGSSSETFF